MKENGVAKSKRSIASILYHSAILSEFGGNTVDRAKHVNWIHRRELRQTWFDGSTREAVYPDDNPSASMKLVTELAKMTIWEQGPKISTA